MMKLRLCCMLLLLSNSIIAQNTVIDSLTKVFQNENNSSLERFKVARKLAIKYRFKNLDSSLYYVDKAILNFEKNKDYSWSNINLIKGEAFFVNEKLDSAMHYFYKAKYFARNKKDRLKYSIDLGVYHKYRSQLDSVYYYKDNAYRLAVELQDTINILTSGNNLANHLTLLGRRKESVTMLYHLLSYINDNKYEKKKAIIYNGIGENHFKMLDYKNAESFYKKAFSLFEKNNQTKFSRRVNNNLTQLYIASKQFTKAEELLKININDSKASKRDLSYMFYNYASLCHIMGRKNEALSYIDKAIKATKQSGYDIKLAEDYLLKGEIWLRDNKTKGIEYLSKSKSFIDMTNDYSLLKQYYENSVKAYLPLEKSFLMEDYLKLMDSIQVAEINNLTSSYQIKYKTTEKEKALLKERAKNEVQRKRYQITSIIWFSILTVGIIAWLLYNQFQKRKKIESKHKIQSLKHAMLESNLNNQINSHDFKNILAGTLFEIHDKAPESYRTIKTLFKLTEASLYANSLTDSLKNQLKQVDAVFFLAKSSIIEPITLMVENTVNPSFLIPKLLLKNLVENAIKHGIQNSGKPGTIKINIKIENEKIHVDVRDNGRGLEKGELKYNKGLGLYRELFVLFNKSNDGKASLKVISLKKGVSVMVSIPLNYKYTV